MTSTSQDPSADLQALRDDVAKLSASFADYVRTQTEGAANTVLGAVDSARGRITETATKAKDRVTDVSADIETTIERNPLAAVLIALVAGIFVGMLSFGFGRR